MYCPQCSQEQIAEEMRFCSRCGFPLAVVSQIVRNGGALGALEAEAKGKLSPRQKGIRWGLIVMAISVLLVPVAAMMTALEEDFAVLFIPTFLIFAIGLVRLLYAFLLAQKTPTENSLFAARKTGQLPDAQASALPAGQSIPVTAWRQPVNTSEMVQPSSVTDHTTKLLADEKEGR
jgi:Ca2+/H+ antiporter